MRRKTLLLTVTLALAVLLAGCTGIGGDRDADPEVDDSVPDGTDDVASEPAADSDADDAVDAPGDAAGADAASPAEYANAQETALTFSVTPGDTDDRDLITTGQIDLTVKNVTEAEAQLFETVEAHGGYVGSSERSVETTENTTWQTAEYVLRIPDDEFDGAFRSIESLGDVDQSSMDVEDVTDQLVDLNARIENLEAERDRLRELFETADETQDVLAVQSELADVQEEIERLEAEQRTLQDRVSMSTLRVAAVEPKPDPVSEDEPPEWYEVGITDAATASFSAMATGARGGVVAVAYLIPFIVVSTPFILGAVAYRRRS